MTTLTSSRKALHVIIKGNRNQFTVSVTTGERGKNVAMSAMFTGGISLLGMGFDIKFTNKLWKFIQQAVNSLENSCAENY